MYFITEISVWEPSGEKQRALSRMFSVTEKHIQSAESIKMKDSEIGWYRDLHRPLLLLQGTVFFCFISHAHE